MIEMLILLGGVLGAGIVVYLLWDILGGGKLLEGRHTAAQRSASPKQPLRLAPDDSPASPELIRKLEQRVHRLEEKSKRLQAQLAEVLLRLEDLEMRPASEQAEPGAELAAAPVLRLGDDGADSPPAGRAGLASGASGPPREAFPKRSEGTRPERNATPETLLGPDPPLQEESPSSSPALSEPALRQFLALCDRSSVDLAAARRWFEEQRLAVQLEPVEGSGAGEWTLLRLASGTSAWLVPAIRRPMGQCPLREHFTLSSYNGLEPLRPQQVQRFARQSYRDGKWITDEPGQIDAS
jgi:hypothetical protein